MRLLSVLRLLLAGTVLVAAWYIFFPPPVSHPPGILVPEIPRQTPIGTEAPWQKGAFTVTPRARFALTARVLSRTRYHDENAELAPYDFALGWQSMSDSAVLDRLSISQFMRLYHYRWQGSPPLDPQRIIDSSANMHMLPADETVRAAMGRVRAGDIISLEGMLVDFTQGRGVYRTSTTRSDTGMGSCEIVWVTSLTIRP